jgi:quinol monooxygenase YgiN
MTDRTDVKAIGFGSMLPRIFIIIQKMKHFHTNRPLLKEFCRRLLFISIVFIMAFTPSFKTFAQSKSQYVRIARILIDSNQLESYKAALREGIETAVRNEPGVLALYAVCDKEHPAKITVFEIYADETAYKTHIQTPHFKKYKDTVKDMVKSLELVDVIPIRLESKSSL